MEVVIVSVLLFTNGLAYSWCSIVVSSAILLKVAAGVRRLWLCSVVNVSEHSTRLSELGLLIYPKWGILCLENGVAPPQPLTPDIIPSLNLCLGFK